MKNIYCQRAISEAWVLADKLDRVPDVDADPDLMFEAAQALRRLASLLVEAGADYGATVAPRATLATGAALATPHE